MDDFLLLLLLRLVVAGLAIATAIVAWLAAEDLAYGRATTSPATIPTTARGIGWIYAWLGMLALMATTLGGCALAIENPQLLTPAPVAAFAGILMLGTLIVVVRSSWTVKDSLAATSQRLTAGGETTGLLGFGWPVLLPLGLSLSLLIFAVLLLILSAVAVGSMGVGDGEVNSIGIATGVLIGEFLVFSGLSFVTAGEMTLSLESRQLANLRRSLSRTLKTLAGVFGLLVAICLSWFGIVVVGLYIVVVIATFGGRRRAAELAAFWTLTTVVRSGRPLEAELQEHALNLRGRTRFLLQTAADRLSNGASWGTAVCATGVAPRATWLELCSAESCDSLAEALQAAAARETVRFARDADPATPRAAIGYFGAVTTVMLALFSFIGYYIVPKLKKIFEDFDMELPELSEFCFEFVSGPGIGLLGVLGVLLLSGLSIVGEVFVESHGWSTAAERVAGAWWHRMRTPDLLRGLRWAVVRQRPLASALEDMASAPVSFQVRSRLHQTASVIRDGQDPWEALCNSRWLTKAEVDLLQSAQAAGNLPWALETLSDSIVARFRYCLEWWLQILHPALTLCLGAMVGIFGVAVLGPVFSQLIGAYS